MKKVLSVVLALVLMLSAVSIIAVAGQEVDFTITIGETRTAYLPGAVYPEYVVARFVAPGSGKVVISSNVGLISDNRPKLEVYKGALGSANLIGKAEGTMLNRNFKYELNCEAGTTYYLAMGNSGSAQKWDVTIECLHETYVDGKCITCFGSCSHAMTTRVEGLKSCACGEAFEGDDILADTTVQLKSRTSRVWFRFVPDETAPYILKSENPDDESTWLKNPADPNFVIVDREGKEVIAKDANVGADNKNFNFPFLLEKGEKYFIGVKDEKVNADDWYFTLLKGTSHTVEVEVEKEVVVENEDGTTSTEIITEVVVEKHNLEYLPHTVATCQGEGHTPSVVCKVCDEVIAGGDIIPQEPECVDSDANNHCDWCNRVMVEPADPSENCSCNCHKKGISKFFFDFALFFQKIFRLNSVCDCGIRHY